MVLRRGAYHAWPTDIDILDNFFEGGAARDGRLERIKIDHYEIDRQNVVLFHFRYVRRIVAQRQNPAVNFWMKCFDSAVHHLGKAGKLGNIFDGDFVIAQQRRRDARGHELDVKFCKNTTKLDDALLVGNTDQGPFDPAHNGDPPRNCSECGERERRWK